MLDGLLDRNLLLVDLYELPLGQLLDLVGHLRLAHLREVNADLFVDALQALQVPLGHFVAGGGQEDGLEDEGEQFLVELGLSGGKITFSSTIS